MINNTTLVGRLTSDPRINSASSGTMIANFNLAVNRPFKNKQTGEYDADFPSVVAFGKTAEIIDQYAKKGMLVGVVGRIQTRNYENNEGQRVYVTEVVAESFQMLESRKEREANNQNNQGNDPFANNIEITDDQLPFW